MPCVENLGANVRAWCDKSGEGSTTHDLCQACAAALVNDPHALDSLLSPLHMSVRAGPEPRGEDGWGGAVDHPPYDQIEGMYGGPPMCAVCAHRLTAEDN